MRVIVPNSWGTERPVREFNPNHEPAGSPKGGQFAKKQGGGVGDILNIAGIRASRGMDGRWYPVTTSGQKTYGPGFPSADAFKQYVETMGGQPRRGYEETTLYKDVAGKEPEKKTEGPVGEEPEPQIVKEPPTAKAKKGGGEDVGGVLGVSNHADDAAVEALGLGDVEQLAENMIAGITSEKFSIEISSEGVSSEPSGPDPREVRSEYDSYIEEASSEAEQNLYSEQKSDYIRHANATNDRLQVAYAAAMADPEFAGKVTFLDSNKPVAASEASTKAFEDLYEASVESLLGDEEGEGSIFNEEGFLGERGEALVERMKGMIRSSIENGVTTLPGEFHGGWEDETLTEHSKYFSEDNGYGNWIDDSQQEGAYEDLPTFESWYADKYGVDPENWDSGGEVDASNAQVTIDYNGDKGTTIRRTFMMKDGELHVHHDFFRVGDERGGGDGLGKELFRSSVAEYQKIGVGSISVYADIDSNGTGKYSWARYGFEAENPRPIHRSMSYQIDRLQTEGVITGKEAKALKGLIQPNDNRNVWEMSDTRLYVGRERALSIIPKVDRGSDEVWNRMLEADAQRGIINIGKIVMAERDASSWEGILNLNDEDQMARLRRYLGD